VIEARNLMAADDNGLSDPYCLLSLGSSKARTRVIKKDLNPRWNQGFRMYASHQDAR
jgi:Ca2+-dependent lipid-binding protein